MNAVVKRFQNLPRDARDTTFILGVVAWTILPHATNLPAWLMVLPVMLLAWRLQIVLTQGQLPKRRVVLGILLLSVALSFWSFQTILGKQAGISILVSLTALKTLELRARRDSFVIFCLGFFLVLTHFFYSQTMIAAFSMLISVWGLLTALVLMHMPVGHPALKTAAGIAARTALLGAPIMVVLFMLFPRLPPLWGVPQDGIGATGLSDRMRMGTVAELALSNEIVMRVKFGERVPSASEMYFRGPVLSKFDGLEWTPSPADSQETRPQTRVEGRPTPYEVTLEPQRSREIPLLELSTEQTIKDLGSGGSFFDLQLTEDLRWRSRQPVFERRRLELTAYTRFQHGPTEFHPKLQQYLQLPPGHSPRTIAWADTLRRKPELLEGGTPAMVQAVLSHIRQENFHYTLTPGTYGDDNPIAAIDEFWLDRRRGFCEHFASAFVLIMRSMGVPARIVTGYQGADPVPVDGYYIVRKNSAHAWAEYWLQGVGWVRADPTASVAPERIHHSANLPAPAGIVTGALQDALGGTDILARWRVGWEAANNRWNQWVLNYSRGQQIDLLKHIGVNAADWLHLGLALLVILGASSIGTWIYLQWRSRNSDPWTRKMEALRHEIRRLGVNVDHHAPPLALSKLVSEHLGDAAAHLARALMELDARRYGPATSGASLNKQFRQAKSSVRALLRRANRPRADAA